MNEQTTERRLRALEFLIKHQSMKLHPTDYAELIAEARSNGAGRYVTVEYSGDFREFHLHLSEDLACALKCITFEDTFYPESIVDLETGEAFEIDLIPRLGKQEPGVYPFPS